MGYEKLELRKAKVIDIVDKDKQGKIKVRIYPDLKDVKEELLPWIPPFISNNSSSVMENDLPEKGSLIRVLVRKDYQRIYYLHNQYYYSLFDFSKVNSLLSKATELSDKTYENIKFRYYLDGSLDFHNNNNGEHGYIQSNGSYFVFDKDGNIIINSKSKIIIKGSTDIELNGNSKQFVTWTELNTAINNLMILLNQHTHVVASLGAPTGPASASVPPTTFTMDISSAKTTTIKTGG